jgi:uncharacterized protein YggT (Ycf19 family)
MNEVTTTTVPYFPRVFLAQFIEAIVGIIEILLIFRIALRFFAANPSSEFVAWIYQISGSLLGPFAGAFPNLTAGSGGVVDVTAILALIVYAVIGWILIQILYLIFATPVS